VQRGRGIHVGWRPNAQPPGYPSATTILPQYQHVQVGTWMPMARTVTQTTALTVTAFETASWLLWEKPDSTWAWQLIPDDGGRTRLISRLRQRYRWQTPGPALLAVALLEFGDFPMMRWVLTGIKARAVHRTDGRRTECLQTRLLVTNATSPAIPKVGCGGRRGGCGLQGPRRDCVHERCAGVVPLRSEVR
jgi:hypothetical protein